MIKQFALLSTLGFTALPAFGHHAKCLTDNDGFMTCGAHSGRVSFDLKSYGDVREDTRQLVLCSNHATSIQDLKISWVESDDTATHFDMNDVKFTKLSPQCTLIANLDFTPHPDFQSSPQNAWKLSIGIDGVDIKSEVYVEAKGTGAHE